MKKALIVIDIQAEYFPGGKVPLHEPEAAAKNAAWLLAECREQGVAIVHVRHTMPVERGVPFLLEGTPGHEIHPSVRPVTNEAVISKRFPNAFRETNLLATLRALEVNQLILCGMMTHMCVDFSAKEAFDLGFAVTVVGDATATCALPFGDTVIPADVVRDANLAALHGIVANVVTTKQAVNELRGGAAARAS